MIIWDVVIAGQSVIDYLAHTDESQNERGCTQRGMRHGSDDRRCGKEKLQMDCNLLCHMARYRAGHINLCAEEAARQALINVVTACSDVA